MAYYLLKGNILSGSTYGGQVKFFGSQGIKEHFLGVSSHLTHIKAGNVPSHLLQQSTGLSSWSPKTLGGAVRWLGAGLDFGGKAVHTWQRYDENSERAGAVAYDLAFVAAKAISSPYVQYAAASVAVAGLTAVGAPVVLIAGGALAAWWGGGVVWDWAADKVYDLSLKVGVQDAIAGASRSVADAATSVFKGVSDVAGQAADWASAKAQEAAEAVDKTFATIKNGISGLGEALSFGF